VVLRVPRLQALLVAATPDFEELEQALPGTRLDQSSRPATPR
jgi:hypothetical protein